MQFVRSRQFKKQFKKLDKTIQQKIKHRLSIFVQNPYSFELNNHKLKGKYLECRSINITGDYRLVYRDVNNGFIELIAIGTHSELYS